MSERGVLKNVVTYILLIKGYCKRGEMEEADGVFRRMSEEKGDMMVMDEKVYGVLIDGFCRVGKMDEAIRIKNEMLNAGLVMNLFIFSSLINGYCKLGALANLVKQSKFYGVWLKET